MNLIGNGQLDRAQKQKIYELTLKKRRCKKSTMSACQLAARQQLARELQEQRRDTPSEGATIKFNKTRLEHLNAELERRIHQYEYLVAQEKALLGACNSVSFNGGGVNNFDLYDMLSTPARRLRTFQEQKQQAGARRQNSAASSVASSKISSEDDATAKTGLNKHGSTASFEATESSSTKTRSSSSSDDSNSAGTTALPSPPPTETPNGNHSVTSSQPKLNTSASTASNLNTLHMLLALAGPRRSASSVALLTINQGHALD